MIVIGAYFASLFEKYILIWMIIFLFEKKKGLATTTGINWVDYYVGDKVGIPTRFQRYYSEKIIYLPHR